MNFDIAIVAAFVIAYALISRRISNAPVSGPIIFVAFGVLVGPEVLGVVDIDLGHGVIRVLAELTLALIIFTDSSRIDIRMLRTNKAVPARLLMIGLPLSVALGTGLGVVMFPDASVWSLAALAAILVPTDAALAQPVMSNEAVPARIRQAVNVESGLNDGLVVPVLLFFTAGALAAGGEASEFNSGDFWVSFAVESIFYALLIGLVLGAATAHALHWLGGRGWVDEAFHGMAILATPILSFFLSEAVGGSGFLAAFISGLATGAVAHESERGHTEFMHRTSELLELLTWVIFGGAMLLQALDYLTWRMALFGVLSLTVIRIVPVAVSLIGHRFHGSTTAFLGWFGPRGLASIVFVIAFTEEKEGLPYQAEILSIVVWTVLLSVIMHGLTASPLAEVYGSRIRRIRDKEDAPEFQEEIYLPTRKEHRRRI